MNPEEFLQAIADCKSYLLSHASLHEQAACYALYVHEDEAEASERKEQKVLLRWASALDSILEKESS